MKPVKITFMVLSCLFLLLGSFNGQAIAGISEDGLVAYYPFNGNADDESGNGHHGSPTNVSWGEDSCGNSDSAAYFDGSSYIVVPHDDALNISDQTITVSFRLNYQGDYSHFSYLISKTLGHEIVYGMYLNTQFPHFWFTGEQGNTNWGVVGGTANQNEWVHIVGIRDHNDVYLYANGELVDHQRTSLGINSNTSNLEFGGHFYEGYWQNLFVGGMDEVRIYNRALSEEEVQALYVYCPVANQPPDANAGSDQTVELAGCEGTEVQLSGSDSTDPDNNIQLFEWFEGETLLGEGEILNYVFPLGVHTVTLKVTDVEAEFDTDDVIITVQDTSPPAVNTSVSQSSLWPANNKMVDIGFGYDASDVCEEDLNISITVTSDEPTATAPGAGGPNHAPDAQFTDDGRILIRAERSGLGDGRVYEIKVTATDSSNNSSSSSVFVRVNHDKKAEAVDSGQIYDATQIN